uniref:Variant surface glycoprotein 1125.3089 n=1 Tax=Trypanosoma brucei TaxID=5691 RepID=A0A1J0R9H9_9TRYP|nr:variant surface glycoprotein 1125.3089 [Trypanosoma brucei]
MWDDWSEAIKGLKETPGKPKATEKHYSQLSPAQLQLAKAELALISETAVELAALQTTTEPASKLIKSNKIGADMKTLFLGNPDAKLSTATRDQIFGPRASDIASRDNACSTAPGAAKLGTLAAAMSCVCQGETDTQADDICFRGQTGANVWRNTAAPNEDAAKEIITKCTTDDHTQKTTYNTIRQALSHIARLATTDGSNTYLGAFKTDCNGQQTNGRCIKWQNKKPHEIFTDPATPWLKDVQDLAEALEAREKHNNLINERTKQLAVLAARARALENTGSFATAILQTAQEAAGSQGKAEQNKADTCATHTVNSTCTKNNCKWEGKSETDGTCKAKDGEEQKNTVGAGETPNAEGKKGSDKKNKRSANILTENWRVKLAKISVFL